MARLARFVVPGFSHHVTQRGNWQVPSAELPLTTTYHLLPTTYHLSAATRCAFNLLLPGRMGRVSRGIGVPAHRARW